VYAYEELKSDAAKQLPGVDQHSLEVCSVLCFLCTPYVNSIVKSDSYQHNVWCKSICFLNEVNHIIQLTKVKMSSPEDIVLCAFYAQSG